MLTEPPSTRHRHNPSTLMHAPPHRREPSAHCDVRAHTAAAQEGLPALPATSATRCRRDLRPHRHRPHHPQPRPRHPRPRCPHPRRPHRHRPQCLHTRLHRSCPHRPRRPRTRLTRLRHPRRRLPRPRQLRPRRHHPRRHRPRSPAALTRTSLIAPSSPSAVPLPPGPKRGLTRSTPYRSSGICAQRPPPLS